MTISRDDEGGVYIGSIRHTPGIECWCKQCELTIFLAARLVNVYKESPNTDYILLAERITGQKVDVDGR